MKYIPFMLAVASLCATSCGTIDMHRPAEAMRLRLGGATTGVHKLQALADNPVRIITATDGSFTLQVPAERYGGMMIGFVPHVKDPEKEWKFSVVSNDTVVLTATLYEIRKITQTEGVRVLPIGKN